MNPAVKYPVHSYVVEQLAYPNPTSLDKLYLSATSYGFSHSQVDGALYELCDFGVVSLHPDMVTYGAGSKTPFVVCLSGKEAFGEILGISIISSDVGCSDLMRYILDWRDTMSQSTLWTCLDFVSMPRRYSHLQKLAALWWLKLTRKVRVIEHTPTDRLVQAVCA